MRNQRLTKIFKFIWFISLVLRESCPNKTFKNVGYTKIPTVWRGSGGSILKTKGYFFLKICQATVLIKLLKVTKFLKFNSDSKKK